MELEDGEIIDEDHNEEEETFPVETQRLAAGVENQENEIDYIVKTWNRIVSEPAPAEMSYDSPESPDSSIICLDDTDSPVPTASSIIIPLSISPIPEEIEEIDNIDQTNNLIERVEEAQPPPLDSTPAIVDENMLPPPPPAPILDEDPEIVALRVAALRSLSRKGDKEDGEVSEVEESRATAANRSKSSVTSRSTASTSQESGKPGRERRRSRSTNDRSRRRRDGKRSRERDRDYRKDRNDRDYRSSRRRSASRTRNGTSQSSRRKSNSPPGRRHQTRSFLDGAATVSRTDSARQSTSEPAKIASESQPTADTSKSQSNPTARSASHIRIVLGEVSKQIFNETTAAPSTEFDSPSSPSPPRSPMPGVAASLRLAPPQNIPLEAISSSHTNEMGDNYEHIGMEITSAGATPPHQYVHEDPSAPSTSNVTKRNKRNRWDEPPPKKVSRRESNNAADDAELRKMLLAQMAESPKRHRKRKTSDLSSRQKSDKTQRLENRRNSKDHKED